MKNLGFFHILNIYLYLFSVPRLKQRFSIVVPPIGDVLATLDAAKVATTILFVTSVMSQANSDIEQEIIDDWGKEIIVSCLAQGLPSTMIAVHNIGRLHIKVSYDKIKKFGKNIKILIIIIK